MLHDADSCHHWKTFGLSEFDEAVCSYTSSYISCFLAVTAVVLIYLGARDLLHKRFYYSLLKADGVLEYEDRFPLRDPLMAILVIDCLHVIAYAGFVLYVILKVTAQANPGVPMDELLKPAPVSFAFKHHSFLQSHTLGVVTFEPTTTGPPVASTTVEFMMPGVNANIAHDLYKRAALVCSILVPGILLVVFAFMDYNITKGLVPLSEYVGDDDEEESTTTFRTLTTCREAGLKLTMPKFCRDEEIRRINLKTRDRAASDADEVGTYSAIIAAWQKERKQYKGQVLPPVNFLGSLWPAKVVLAAHLEDTKAKLFRDSVKAFIAFGIIILLVNLGALVHESYARLGLLMSGRTVELGGTIVSAAHVLLLCLACLRLGTCSSTDCG